MTLPANFSALTPRFSGALLHNLQLISDRCLIFESYLATGMIPAIAIISRLLCLQVTRRSFKYFAKNSLFSFCHNMKSAVHVPYAGSLILSSLLQLAHMISRIFGHQSKRSAARPSPRFGMMPHIVACMCSPLSHHLYTIFHIVA